MDYPSQFSKEREMSDTIDESVIFNENVHQCLFGPYLAIRKKNFQLIIDTVYVPLVSLCRKEFLCMKQKL